MILVFVGAGGSAAVDPKQYPTTVEFFNRLPREITQDPLFTLVCEFLRSQKEDGQPIDIEEVLLGLDKLQEYLSLSHDPNTLEGWMMTRNRLGSLHANMSASSNISAAMFEIDENRLVPLQNRINALVHEFYVVHPAHDKLRDWVNLLRGLEMPDSLIEIFTTNYDLVLETAIQEAEIKIVTGRVPALEMQLDPSFWDKDSELHRDCGRLTKLHGSVDWQLRGDSIICSTLYTEDPNKHSILYPGFKGEPNKEPFIKFHEYLRAVVREAEAAVFIGFAFRDVYINSILSDLPSEIPTWVINKGESLPDLPFTNSPEHIRGGLTTEAVRACLRSLQLRTFQGAKLYNDRGLAKSESRDFPGAITDYNKAIEIDPQYAKAYNNRGLAKSESRDFPGAITDYNKAIEIDPQYAKAYNNRGLAKSESRDFPGAITDYNKAIEIDPQYAKAYNNRGLAKSESRDFPGAITDYNKAIEIDPQYAKAYNNRGLAKSESRDFPGAITDYNKAIEIDPQYAKAYNNRGVAKSKSRDFPGAITDYNKAIEIDPQYAKAYNNRGVAKRKSGDPAGAIADHNRAIQLDSSLGKDEDEDRP